MTVKIIKEGRLPENDTFRCTCSHCKTLFEFQRKDAKSGCDQRSGNWMTINCPLCSKTVYPAEKNKVEYTEDEGKGHIQRDEYVMHSMPGYYDDGVYRKK